VERARRAAPALVAERAPQRAEPVQPAAREHPAALQVLRAPEPAALARERVVLVARLAARAPKSLINSTRKRRWSGSPTGTAIRRGVCLHGQALRRSYFLAAAHCCSVSADRFRNSASSRS
jgi:hypothetical protein